MPLVLFSVPAVMLVFWTSQRSHQCYPTPHARSVWHPGLTFLVSTKGLSPKILRQCQVTFDSSATETEILLFYPLYTIMFTNHCFWAVCPPFSWFSANSPFWHSCSSAPDMVFCLFFFASWLFVFNLQVELILRFSSFFLFFCF